MLGKRWDFQFENRTSLPDPIGYRMTLGEAEGSTLSSRKTRERSSRHASIVESKAWEAALAPGKSIGMTIFMLWMGGSSPGIFSILIMGYGAINTVKSLFGLNAAFASFETAKVNVMLQKLVYVLINLAALGYISYHCAHMGLLPISSGDYIAMIPEKKVLEFSTGIVT
ncbi:unnamed protein product [Vitrella brassicaformis CCMP3155]|uniref:ER membrane protein complex subunit 4 n=2 Tax=Vitrella brassicaformis TaxID=1169539 RepID=A0A0G4FNC3_VITBC|nr:unnamed protein product [Vitrella brassicaformis CCMP3155]|eukprot:CEM15696.1 unnamed protein product [Vitrella brassicaformis CCMP3155]